MKYCLMLFSVLFASVSWSQTTKVLIVGDSWAQQQWVDGVHDAVFAVNGYSQFVSLGDEVAISGSTAAEWVAPTELQKITDALINNPDIDTVQLTLGGNDFLDQWDTSMTAMEVTNIQNQIMTDLQIVIDHILAQRIDIEVVLSFYDYPNFVDTIGGFTGGFCYDLHQSLGAPTPTELNNMAVSFVTSFASIAATNPKVFYVSHFGLMQNLYGFPDGGIQPGDILPPGDVSLPSPVESMRINFEVVVDCFHLRAEGYDVLVQNLFEQYYLYRFDTIHKSLFE